MTGGPSSSISAMTAADVSKKYMSRADVVGRTFYTKVNVLFDKSGGISTMNNHEGTMLPLGTKVSIVEVSEDYIFPKIHFVDASAKKYEIVLERGHDSDVVTCWFIFNQVFSEAEPQQGGGARIFSEEELNYIRLGKVGLGMTKAAVLKAFGYPPAPARLEGKGYGQVLESNVWSYPYNSYTEKKVYFIDYKVAHIQEAQ